MVMRILARSLRRLVRRGVVSLIDDHGDLQQLQIRTADGLLDDVPCPQAYGLAAHPPKGSRAVVLMLNADPSSPVALNPDDSESRPKNLGEGEVVLYAKGGAEMRLAPDGTIAITGTTVTIGALEISDTGVRVNGKMVALVGDQVTTPDTLTGTIIGGTGA